MDRKPYNIVGMAEIRQLLQVKSFKLADEATRYKLMEKFAILTSRRFRFSEFTKEEQQELILSALKTLDYLASKEGKERERERFVFCCFTKCLLKSGKITPDVLDNSTKHNILSFSSRLGTSFAGLSTELIKDEIECYRFVLDAVENEQINLTKLSIESVAKYFEICNNAAVAYFESKQESEAICCWLEALNTADNPKLDFASLPAHTRTGYISTCYNLGTLYYDMGMVSNALFIWAKAIEFIRDTKLKPSDFDSHQKGNFVGACNNMGVVLSKLGFKELANEIYFVAVEAIANGLFDTRRMRKGSYGTLLTLCHNSNKKVYSTLTFHRVMLTTHAWDELRSSTADVNPLIYTETPRYAFPGELHITYAAVVRAGFVPQNEIPLVETHLRHYLNQTSNLPYPLSSNVKNLLAELMDYEMTNILTIEESILDRQIPYLNALFRSDRGLHKTVENKESAKDDSSNGNSSLKISPVTFHEHKAFEKHLVMHTSIYQNLVCSILFLSECKALPLRNEKHSVSRHKELKKLLIKHHKAESTPLPEPKLWQLIKHLFGKEYPWVEEAKLLKSDFSECHENHIPILEDAIKQFTANPSELPWSSDQILLSLVMQLARSDMQYVLPDMSDNDVRQCINEIVDNWEEEDSFITQVEQFIEAQRRERIATKQERDETGNKIQALKDQDKKVPPKLEARYKELCKIHEPVIWNDLIDNIWKPIAVKQPSTPQEPDISPDACYTPFANSLRETLLPVQLEQPGPDEAEAGQRADNKLPPPTEEDKAHLRDLLLRTWNTLLDEPEKPIFVNSDSTGSIADAKRVVDFLSGKTVTETQFKLALLTDSGLQNLMEELLVDYLHRQFGHWDKKDQFSTLEPIPTLKAFRGRLNFFAASPDWSILAQQRKEDEVKAKPVSLPGHRTELLLDALENYRFQAGGPMDKPQMQRWLEYFTQESLHQALSSGEVDDDGQWQGDVTGCYLALEIRCFGLQGLMHPMNLSNKQEALLRAKLTKALKDCFDQAPETDIEYMNPMFTQFLEFYTQPEFNDGTPLVPSLVIPKGLSPPDDYPMPTTEHALPEGQLLVQPFSVDETWYVLMQYAQNGTTQSHLWQLDIDNTALTELLPLWLEAWKETDRKLTSDAPNVTFEKILPETQQILAPLMEKLIQIVEEAGINAIKLVLPQALQPIAWEWLLSTSEMKDIPVSRLVSISTWLAHAGQKPEAEDSANVEGSVDKATETQPAHKKATGVYLASEQESDIQQVFAPLDVKHFLSACVESEAERTVLKDNVYPLDIVEAFDSDYLHLTLHGRHDPAMPWEASLKLDKNLRLPVRLISMYRETNQTMPEHVSLGCCTMGDQTGNHWTSLGMASALIACGVSTVIAPMAKVHPVVNYCFFKTLYTHYKSQATNNKSWLDAIIAAKTTLSKTTKLELYNLLTELNKTIPAQSEIEKPIQHLCDKSYQDYLGSFDLRAEDLTGNDPIKGESDKKAFNPVTFASYILLVGKRRYT